MPTITLTVGLPGCGKTTWAVQEIKKAKSKTININRDDIRESMAGSHDAYKFNDANEKYVTNLQFSAANSAAENGWNIIISDTNLKQHFRNLWKVWAIDNGYDYKEKNFYDDFVPNEDRGADVHEFFKIKEFVKLCKKYNLQRERSVQDNIIDTMADTYYYSKAMHIGYYGNSREAAVIVDIDGTLAHKWGRNPFDESTVLQDTPDEEVILSVIAEAVFHKRKVIIMSGRTEGCRADTEQWLKNWGVPYDALFMRGIDDKRPDDVVKFDLYMKNVVDHYDVKKVYDDRAQVVFMWRKLLGLKVMQVAEGNF